MKNKKTLRRFLYIAPVVLFAAAAISCFAIASNIRKGYTSNKEVQSLSADIMNIQREYIANPDAYLNPEGEKYEEYTTAQNRLKQISSKTNGQYSAFSISAYITSILTLVSFGVVLYASDKAKEKEESYVEPIKSPEEDETEEEKELEELEREIENE